MDTFLSNVIIRNRPRVVLFSPKPHPSLTVKLVALARHTTTDFGFVSTQQRGASRAFLRRFGVTPGEKQLLVFKEYQEPELSVEVSAWLCCLFTSMQAILHMWPAQHKSRLSVPDFVSQLWRKIGFFSKAARQNPDFAPKLRDKIRNGEPGNEASAWSKASVVCVHTLSVTLVQIKAGHFWII